DTFLDYQQCLDNVQFDCNNKQMVFVINVLNSTNVFPSQSTFHSSYKSEAILGSLMAHPVLQYLVNATNSQPYYVPGEICLTASANQHFLRRDLKPTDDKPLGMKVDGLFCSSRNEIGMVESSGDYLTFDMP
ncbi:6270_t:CDS:2, partial [Entrophospora sp. SA101]